MRLFRVELTRLLSRRACVVLLLIGLAGAALVAGSYVHEHAPPSDSEVAAATRLAEREARQPYVVHQLTRCQAGKGSFPTGFDCQQVLPTASDYLYSPRINLRGQDLGDLVVPMLLALAIAALLLGATYIGADWSSGTVSTLLLFETRRTRVWVAKAVSVFVGTAVPAGLAIGLGLLAVVWFGHRWDNMSSLHGHTDHLVWVWLRSTLIVGLAALSGFAIVMAMRFTAAALGMVLAYALVGEAVLRSVWNGSEQWLLSNHLFGFVLGRWRVQVYPSDCYPGPCRPRSFFFGLENTSLYLGVLAAGALLVSYVVFRRRDVP
jgi:ABC-type transport system involved in multi-copper enzyme maturation permease subunit